MAACMWGSYLVLIAKVGDEAVGVIVVGLVEWGEEREVFPVSVVLVAHVIAHTADHAGRERQ